MPSHAAHSSGISLHSGVWWECGEKPLLARLCGFPVTYPAGTVESGVRESLGNKARQVVPVERPPFSCTQMPTARASVGHPMSGFWPLMICSMKSNAQCETILVPNSHPVDPAERGIFSHGTCILPFRPKGRMPSHTAHSSGISMGISALLV
jgi:hypothetical protein